MLLWYYLLGLFLLHTRILVSDAKHSVYIDGINGNNSLDCLTASDPTLACHDLDWTLEHIEFFDFTTFVFSEGEHIVKNQLPLFTNITSMAFIGNSSSIVCASELIGFGFHQIIGISFISLKFLNCGALRNSTSNNFDMENSTDIFQVALYFESCSDLEMEEVVITSSYNTTGLVIYDGSGTNTFRNCLFFNNTVQESDTGLKKDSAVGGGGGGVYVELTFCQPGTICEYSEKAISNALYKFINCTFKDNRACVWRRGSFIHPQKMNHQAFARGGGLSLYIRGNNSNTQFVVDECLFENNEALWGGGFFVELNDNAYGNSILVNNSKFIHNTSPLELGGGGGGLRLTHYIYESDSAHVKNMFFVDNTIFIDNLAINGGGLSISWAQQRTLLNNGAEFKLSNLVFESNLGRLGSAVYIDQFWKLTRHDGVEAYIEITDCHFLSNSDSFYEKMPNVRDVYETGIGSVYLSSSSVTFLNTANFTSNKGSALAISDGNIVIEDCNAHFYGNNGSIGGAIVLFGSSTLDIGRRTQMQFESNTALLQGGAIYVETLSRQTRKNDVNCFVRYADSYLTDPVSMIFIENKDHGGNNTNSIHATSILPCSNFFINNTATKRTGVFCLGGWEYYTSREDYRNNITSECEQHIRTDIGQLSLMETNVNATPGWEFELPIDVSDDLGAEITSQDVFFNLKPQKDDPDVNDSISICRKNVEIKDIADTTLNFTLTAVGQRVWSMDIKVQMNKCPPGFFLSNDRVCICDNSFKFYVECNENTKVATIDKNVWMGLISNEDPHYYALDCPYHYCFDRKDSGAQLLEDTGMCGYNRTGILCGKCLEGYGTAVNSLDYECIQCNDTSLAAAIVTYAVLTYLPLSLLFTVIILFDIRLTTGPANAFILYSQLITTMFSLDANGGIPLSKILNGSDTMMNIYKFPYDIFNLNIRVNYFDPICFSPGMDTAAVFCLQYGVAFFPLTLILLTIVVLKVKECCCGPLDTSSQTRMARFLRSRLRNANNALLPAFAACILLSYTKFSIISSNLTRSVVLIKGDIFVRKDNVSRLFFAGHHDSNSLSYKLYRSIGILMFSVFVVPIPLLLLDFPVRIFERLVSKSSVLTRLYPAIKIHILLDTFQGCYKKNVRFFAGLYFCSRLIVTVAYSYCETWVERFVIQQLTITIIIILLALFKPYKEELNFVNYVDILILSNLAFLNCLSFYLYAAYRIDLHDEYTGKHAAVFYIQYIAVFLPLLYMIGYLMFRQWTKLKLNKLRMYTTPSHTRDFDSQLLERAEKVNSYVHRLPAEDSNNGNAYKATNSSKSSRLLSDNGSRNSYQSTLQLEDSISLRDNSEVASIKSSGMM